VRRTRLLPHRSHRARHDRDRRAVAAHRPAAARPAGAQDDRALGHGAARMTLLLKIWSAYVRLTARWPSIASIVPFIPLFAAWWIVTTLEIFPRVFLPGPGEVWRSFVARTWKGILPEYLQDSVVRLAVGAAWGIALGIPLG